MEWFPVMGRHQFKLFSLIFTLLLVMMPLSAQETRDYAITDVNYEIIDSNVNLVIDVVNQGADGSGQTSLVVRLLGEEGRTTLFTDQLDELAADETFIFDLSIPIAEFPEAGEYELEISVGIDAFERLRTPIAENNIQQITIEVPEANTPLINPDIINDTIFELTADGVIFLGEPYTRQEVAVAAAGAVGILLLLWLVTIIFRMIFNRPPRFGPWQPPYGVMPMYDQNSIEGRRWAWQQHAQNGLLLAPPTEGNIHPIKLLLSENGDNLKNWKVTAMRLSQYDTYGRIARTQVLAESKWIKRLNRVLKRREKVNEVKLQKMLRPIAQAMVKRFNKKISKKTAFLPIAFDMRLEGKHGEVRIFFELYQCRQYAWYQIDRWEPMMQVVSQTMQENYGFTIHGKDAAEKMGEFRDRLRDDLIWLLLESIRLETTQATVEETGEQPVARPQYDVPDTLSGMEPIEPDVQMS